MITIDAILGILDLVGSLDGKPGDDSGGERIRRYLDRQIHDVGTLRNFTKACYSATSHRSLGERLGPTRGRHPDVSDVLDGFATEIDGCTRRYAAIHGRPTVAAIG